MVTSSINCSSRTYKYSYVTRGPLLVGFRVRFREGLGLSRGFSGSLRFWETCSRTVAGHLEVHGAQ